MVTEKCKDFTGTEGLYNMNLRQMLLGAILFGRDLRLNACSTAAIDPEESLVLVGELPLEHVFLRERKTKKKKHSCGKNFP